MIRLKTFAAAALLAACATTAGPSYTAATTPGGIGYSTDEADGEDRYAVRYVGGSKTKRDEVVRYALLRAAELTLEQGKEWFAVIGTQTAGYQPGELTDLSSRGGAFLGGESASTGTGADAGEGFGDSPEVTGGPSFGGFGGGAVPYQVQERWRRPDRFQSTILIQIGSGDEASFPDLREAPQIFDAQSLVDEMNAEES